MVNNYTNINKSNNHLSPQLIQHKKQHDRWRCEFMSWVGTGTNMWEGKLLMGPQPSTLGIWIPISNTIINKWDTDFKNSIPLKKIIYYYKNKWQHQHQQYNSRVNECNFMYYLIIILIKLNTIPKMIRGEHSCRLETYNWFYLPIAFNSY